MIKLLLLVISITLPSSLWAIDTTFVPSQYTDLNLSDSQLFDLDEHGNRYALVMVAGKLESSKAPGSSTNPG